MSRRPSLQSLPGPSETRMLHLASCLTALGGHRGYGAAVAPKETGKDPQDDETNTGGKKYLQVVIAAHIEEAAAFQLLNNLRHSSPEKLNFHGCWQIPSTAWQKLRGASWTNLREANFSGCLVLQTCLRCLASSLDAMFFSRQLSRLFVRQQTLGNIEWPKM